MGEKFQMIKFNIFDGKITEIKTDLRFIENEISHGSAGRNSVLQRLMQSFDTSWIKNHFCDNTSGKLDRLTITDKLGYNEQMLWFMRYEC